MSLPALDWLFKAKVSLFHVSKVERFLCVKLLLSLKIEGNGQNEIINHMDRSEVKL